MIFTVSLKRKLSRGKIARGLSQSSRQHDRNIKTCAPDTYRATIVACDLSHCCRANILRLLFPLSSRLAGSQWPTIANTYLKAFGSEELRLYQLGKGFASGLTKYSGALCSVKPHWPEVVQLEWGLVMASCRSPGTPPLAYVPPKTTDELNSYGPVLNGTVVLRSFTYPMPAIVSRLRSNIALPEKIRPATTHMVIFRGNENDHCHLLELSGVVARLISLLLDENLSYTQIIEAATPLARQTDTVEAIVSILELIDKLQNSGIFIGSTPVSGR